jgi:Putative tRNA binding domain.
MNLFYNREGIGDVLLVSFRPIDRNEMETERKGDIIRIFRTGTEETFGYNIFHASRYFPLDGERGPVKAGPDLVEKINRVLEAHQFPDRLRPDLSPKFVVGLVKKKEKHPHADKLSVCLVDIGEETLQIVCGAPNVAAGQKVVVAKIGAVMPDGLVIQKSALRGVESNGMICSARELGLPNAPEKKGILVLDDSFEVGQPFSANANSRG